MSDEYFISENKDLKAQEISVKTMLFDKANILNSPKYLHFVSLCIKLAHFANTVAELM